MRLFLNTVSPYARLIRAVVIETGLENETELVYVDPWNSPDDLITANPAGKIPALRLDDGTNLIESSCIADYLVRRAGDSLAPHRHPDALPRLERLGLGRAAMDCAFGAVVQRRFASDSVLVERWLGALPRIAHRLDAQYAKSATTDCDLGDLTTAVAFDYVDFRLPQVAWRNGAPRLAERIAMLGERPSLRATQPE